MTAARKRGPRVGPIAVGLATAAFVALLVYGVTARAPNGSIDQELADSKPADPAPLSLPLLAPGDASDPRATAVVRASADERVRLDELDGPIVLNFWASWCQPCIAEARVLESAWERSRDVLFLGVNQQDLTDDALGFVERQEVSFPSVRDKTDATGRAWGLTGLPETFFIDRDGRVVGHVIGAIDEKRLAAGLDAARSGRILGEIEGGERRSTR